MLTPDPELKNEPTTDESKGASAKSRGSDSEIVEGLRNTENEQSETPSPPSAFVEEEAILEG